MQKHLFRPYRAMETNTNLTRGGGNARQARIALPRADLLRPLRGEVASSCHTTR